MTQANDLIFEPVTRTPQSGNEMQVAKTIYKGIEIIERTFFPWSPFERISVHYMVDLVFPIGTLDCLSEDFYTEEGYGVPVINTIEEAMVIIDNFKK
jgi:hypothetical protein